MTGVSHTGSRHVAGVCTGERSGGRLTSPPWGVRGQRGTTTFFHSEYSPIHSLRKCSSLFFWTLQSLHSKKRGSVLKETQRNIQV